MQNKALSKEKKEFTNSELEIFFKKLDQSGRTFSPAPSLEQRDVTSDWVTTSGSSKQSNKLVKITAWQTGQAF